MPKVFWPLKQHRPTPLAMSTTPRKVEKATTPRKVESGKRKVVLGTVAVRPADKVYEELRRACRHDRQLLSTPIPRPASGSPASFFVTQGPPLPAPPPSRKADVGPAPLVAERKANIASVKARVQRETEEVIRPLRRIAEEAAPSASWSAAPERTAQDPYDLRRWFQ